MTPDMIFKALVPPAPSRPRIMTGVACTFLPLACISLALRIWVKVKMLRSWGWDDWWAVATLGSYAAECGVLITMAKLEQDGVQILYNSKLIAVLILPEQALYIAGTITLKFSLSVYYLRFLRERWQRYTIIFATACYTLFALALIGLVIFMCGIPSWEELEKTFTPGLCVPFHVFKHIAVAHAVLNSLIDFIFALFPIGVLWRSFLPRPTKISACVLIGLAIFSSIASCVRTWYIPGLEPTPRFYNTSTNALIWSVVEPGLGICAACLCTLRPLFRKWMEGVKVIASRGRSPSGKGKQKGGAAGILVTESLFKVSHKLSSDAARREAEEFEPSKRQTWDLEKGIGRGRTVTTIVGDATSTEDTEMVDLKDILRRWYSCQAEISRGQEEIV
ncbi:hypothetical protein AAFC00_006268 [Neodothiora populina]|uniref:Rhodopsin domain-containing protein n=1 Tax=Neodothiora populina TaxID=2781224 RepID=A0ABR3P5F6_9PEZI